MKTPENILVIKLYYNEIFSNAILPKSGRFHRSFTQSAFTCSKLTIKTLKHGVKYVQS